MCKIAFRALSLLAGLEEVHLAYKNWVMRCWHCYMYGARCKWFACGPVDATATPMFLALLKSRMVYVSAAGLPRLSGKEAVK